MPMHPKSTLAALAVLTALCGCQKRAQDTDTALPPANDDVSAQPVPDAATPVPSNEAIARLSPTQGNQASGTVRFAPTSEGVRITIDVTGLTSGPHGFHVHENGDCSAPDASSAGAHFNPTDMPHGAPGAEKRHVGDFGNLQADPSGRAHAEFVDPTLSMEGPNSVIGRAAVVHAQADDLTSQPSGNSGARIACGVIQTGQRP